MCECCEYKVKGAMAVASLRLIRDRDRYRERERELTRAVQIRSDRIRTIRASKWEEKEVKKEKDREKKERKTDE